MIALREPLDDDTRGATPVVGIVLLVAITIVLAALAANAVFGLDLLRQDAGPAISFSTEYDEPPSELTITHQSGTEVEWADVTVLSDEDGEIDGTDITAPSTLSSGTKVVVQGVQPGETIRLVWDSPDTDNSFVVYEYTV